MSLKNRLAKIEKDAPAVEKVHFLGWADCEWKIAEGLVRVEGETKERFFKRIQATTDKKWIWCD